MLALFFDAKLLQEHSMHGGGCSQEAVQSEHKKPAAEARSGRCEQSAGADSIT